MTSSLPGWSDTNCFAVFTAIPAASSRGKQYTPVEIDGKAIERPEIAIDGGRVTMRFLYGGEAREHTFTVGETAIQ